MRIGGQTLTRRGVAVLVALGLMGVAVAGYALTRDSGESAQGRGPNQSTPPEDLPPVPKKAYLKDACKLPPRWMLRVERGWVEGGLRDTDIVLVPHPPNYNGSFILTSHSGPYPFLQQVPLVFYGKGFIEQQGRIDLGREVTLADVAPTQAALMGFNFPQRAGSPIHEIIPDTAAAPKMIVTVSMDGGGWDALDRWRGRWPNIEHLIAGGVNIEGATVGSSPSITPAIHTNISTGTFPREHGVTAIAVRADDGSIIGAFSKSVGYTGPLADPSLNLKVETLGDLWDKATDNRAEVGYVGGGNYPIGMLGHGSQLYEADKDIAGILHGDAWETNPEIFTLGDYVNDEVPGPEEDIAAVDRLDGKADEKWQGHSIEPFIATPALAPWETRVVTAIWDHEHFGDDDITDLFYVQFKSPDAAGHKWNMINPEQGDVLESVDRGIGDLVEWLDDNVGPNNYVFTLTADHGQTPLDAGGWPISRGQIHQDTNARFDHVNDDAGIIKRTSATSYFMNVDEMEANDVTPEQVSSFLSRYTIGENIPPGNPVPKGYEERVDERVFDAVFPGRKIPKIMACTGADKLR